MKQLSFAALFAVALAGNAQAQDTISCHSQANLAATEWARGVLTPISSSVAERPGNALLVIANGHMFDYRPVPVNDVRVLQELGHKIRDFNLLWQAENDRCQGGERGLVILRY